MKLLGVLVHCIIAATIVKIGCDWAGTPYYVSYILCFIYGLFGPIGDRH